jgi:outer membrane murein-binding lipoprotein Lpp
MTIDQMAEKISELEAENRGLVDDLRVSQDRVQAAEAALQGANAMVRDFQRCYTRTGW